MAHPRYFHEPRVFSSIFFIAQRHYFPFVIYFHRWSFTEAMFHVALQWIEHRSRYECLTAFCEDKRFAKQTIASLVLLLFLNLENIIV